MGGIAKITAKFRTNRGKDEGPSAPLLQELSRALNHQDAKLSSGTVEVLRKLIHKNSGGIRR